MNFQERFKGKTSVISKEGIDGLVAGPINPIKKDSSVSFSITQLPQVTTTTSLDNSPKRPRKNPLSTTSGSRTSVQIADPALPTPKSYTPNPALGNGRYRLSDLQNQFEPPQPFHVSNKSTDLTFKEELGLLRRASPLKQRNRPLNRRSASGIGVKSANISQLFSEPLALASDHSGFSFNPNNFYNQQSQYRASGNTLDEVPRVQPRSAFELKANRNHLHRKSFESLSQQNKQKHISQDVFRNLVKPTFQQHINEPSPHGGQSDFVQQHRMLRVYESAQVPQRFERSISYNSVPLADMSGLQGAHEPHSIREMNKGDNSRYNYSEERTPGRTTPQNDQVIVLSRLKYRPLSIVEKIDGGGFSGKKVYFKDTEESSERKDVVKFTRLQENGRPTHINLSNMYMNKPRSMDRPRPSWGEPIDAMFK